MAKKQRLRPDPPPLSKDDIKAGQKVFREWCGDNGVVVDAFSAADLCKKISIAIAFARKANSCPLASHLVQCGQFTGHPSQTIGH